MKKVICFSLKYTHLTYWTTLYRCRHHRRAIIIVNVTRPCHRLPYGSTTHTHTHTHKAGAASYAVERCFRDPINTTWLRRQWRRMFRCLDIQWNVAFLNRRMLVYSMHTNRGCRQVKSRMYGKEIMSKALYEFALFSVFYKFKKKR